MISRVSQGALMLLLAYFVGLGATFNGILDIGIRIQSMQIFTVLLAVWLFIHWRSGWRWRATPLDWAVLLWIVAFALSLIGNFDSWRRIAIGLWFMGVYIALWYMLSDLLANRAFTRQALLNALLFTGVIIMIFAWVQVGVWAQRELPAMLDGRAPFSLLRPVSVLGNANTLAAALVMILPVSLVQAVRERGVPRIIMGIYAVSAALLLLLTFSRAGWLGAAAGVAAVALWMLADRGKLKAGSLRSTWSGWTVRRKTAAAALAIIAIIGMVAGAVFIVNSFSIGGRSLDLRTFIYETAWQMFSERPLYGYGLFTFGGGLSRLNPMPPTEPHSHAHSIPLNVAAELGIAGLAALVVTFMLIIRAARHNAAVVQGRERFALIGAGGACAGFAVHHLLDLPAMSPSIMIMGIFVLVAFITPPLAKDAPAARSYFLRGALLAALSAALVIVGLWSALLYQRYWWAVDYAIQTHDYTGGAAMLDPIIAEDPALPLYYQQQGMLYGFAAAQGDDAALAQAIDAFERFSILAPEYTSGWYNLAALYAQAGLYEQAAAALRRAGELSPLVLENSLSAQVNEISLNPETVFRADDPFLTNINPIQWLSYAIPRQWLPQTRLALPDPIRALLAAADEPG